MKSLTLVANTRLKYDPTLTMYYLGNEEGMTHFYHCPSCGGKLPVSKSDRLTYIESSSDEVAAVNAKLMGITNLDQAIKKFGNPDKEVPRGFEASKSEELYHSIPIKRTLMYTQFETIVLCVQETMAGEIITSILKKPRR